MSQFDWNAWVNTVVKEITDLKANKLDKELWEQGGWAMCGRMDRYEKSTKEWLAHVTMLENTIVELKKQIDEQNKKINVLYREYGMVIKEEEQIKNEH